MGTSSTPQIQKTFSDLDIIRSIPNDQYTCSECPIVPEILNIFYNTNEIEIKCQAHGIKRLPIKEYFLKENTFIYNNLKCQICNKKKTNQIMYKYCYNCKKNLCYDCSIRHNKHNDIINLNDVNNKCNEHEGDCDFLLYCFTCNKNICSKVSETEHKEHNKDIISKYKPEKKEIEIIKNNINIYQKDLELLECLVKINKTILETYEKHPNNYYHNINLTNIYQSLEKSKYDDFLNNRNANKEILKEFNDKFDKKVSGFEKVLNFGKMKLGNNILTSLKKINFDNLEVLNLENNDIDDISCFNDWKLERLKELNLSDNNIKDISAIKEINNLCSNVEKIDLSNNQISSINALDNEKIINNLNIKEINLRHNKINYNSTEVKNILNKYKSRIKK